MKRPPKPKADRHETVRCDGSVVKWTDKWEWSPYECDECGHRPAGEGHWENRGVRACPHVGQWKSDESSERRDRGDLGTFMFSSLSFLVGPVPGVWLCCGKREGDRARIINITDPALIEA